MTIRHWLQPMAAVILLIAASTQVHAYTIEQLTAELGTYSVTKGKTLQDANDFLNRLGYSNIDINEVNALLLGVQSLRVVVGTTSYTTNLPSGGGFISHTGSPVVETLFSVTDRASFVRLLDALRSTSNLTATGTGFTITGTDSKLMRILSTVNGSYLTLDSNHSPVCTSASGVQFTLGKSLSGALNCMGIGDTLATVSALNAINSITLSNFVFNRPTSEFSNHVRFMSEMRDMAAVENKPNAAMGGSSGADQYRKINEDLGLYFAAGGSFGSIDRQSGASGLDIYRRTASLGLDYRFTESINSGLLFNYLSSSYQVVGTNGNSYSDIFRVAPYLSMVPFENTFIDTSIGYGYYDNQTSRSPSQSLSPLQGNFHSHEAFGTVKIGYSYRARGWGMTQGNRIKQ